MSENAEASTSTPRLLSRENMTTLVLSLAIVGLSAAVLLPRVTQEEISVLSWGAILGAAVILVALVLQLTIWRPAYYTTFLVRALTMIIILVALMFFEPLAGLMPSWYLTSGE